MSKSKKKAEKTAAAPAKAAGLRVPLDGQYIGKLAGILLAITAVTALLLGAVNYVTAPRHCRGHGGEAGGRHAAGAGGGGVYGGGSFPGGGGDLFQRRRQRHRHGPL